MSKQTMTFQQAMESGDDITLKGLKTRYKNLKKVLEATPQEQITDEMWDEFEIAGELVHQFKIECKP